MLEHKLVFLGFTKMDNRWVNTKNTIVLPRMENDPESLSRYLRQVTFNKLFAKEVRLRYYALYEVLFRTPIVVPPPPKLSPSSNNSTA